MAGGDLQDEHRRRPHVQGNAFGGDGLAVTPGQQADKHRRVTFKQCEKAAHVISSVCILSN
jgi:hypothetical protein